MSLNQEEKDRLRREIKESMDNFFQEIFGEMMVEVTLDNHIKKVGDKVKVVNSALASYMIDCETGEQLGKAYENGEMCDVIVNLEAIVVAVDTGFTFNCGHCDRPHSADTTVFYPDLNKKYHIEPTSLNLVTDTSLT